MVDIYKVFPINDKRHQSRDPAALNVILSSYFHINSSLKEHLESVIKHSDFFDVPSHHSFIVFGKSQSDVVMNSWICFHLADKMDKN